MVFVRFLRSVARPRPVLDAALASVSGSEPMHHELHLRDQSQGMRACLFHEVIDRRDPAQDTEQEQHRNDVDIGQGKTDCTRPT